MSTERQTFREKTRASLDSFDERFKKLTASAKAAGSDVNEDFSEALDDLRARRASTSEALKRLRDASDDSWKELKSGVQNAWDELEQAADDLGSGIKKAAGALKPQKRDGGAPD